MLRRFQEAFAILALLQFKSGQERSFTREGAMRSFRQRRVIFGPPYPRHWLSRIGVPEFNIRECPNSVIHALKMIDRRASLVPELREARLTSVDPLVF